jgi:host factor-I protein
MGSSFEHHPNDLDTSQPGVRQIQAWIRSRATLSVLMLEGTSLSGVARWVDNEYLGLAGEPGADVMLLNRQAIAVIRVLG